MIDRMNNMRWNPDAGMQISERPGQRQQAKTTPAYTKAPGAGVTGGLGTLDYDQTSSAGYSATSLPAIGDADKYYAQVVQNQYETSIQEFEPFEQALISSLDDTSLIDAVRPDVAQQTEIAKGIAERNRQRYGYEQTAAEASESQRATQRGQALNLAGGLNTARIAQRQRNRNLMADLMNIGAQQNRSSLYQLGTSAQNAVDRANAFTQAKAQSKAQSWGMIGNFLGNVASLI